jgi:hypothetical protein
LFFNYLVFLEDNETSWQYVGTTVVPTSSLLIHAGSFLLNKTYLFMVRIEDRQNSSLQAVGHLLVRIEQAHSPLIIIG